jgi:putative transposase
VAIYQRPNTSKAAPEHTKYPYLLGGLTIDRANQVWCSDITYIPLAKGFIYLVAIMDWHSRAVLAWRLSNTLHGDFCVDALEEALRRFGRPEIFNTDQGSQFTIHRRAEGPRHQNQHGRQGPVHGQHLR